MGPTMKAVVSEKGQVTIPHHIRKCLGITPGTVIDFEEREGLLIGKKHVPDQDPVARITGILAQPEDGDAYLNESRGPAE